MEENWKIKIMLLIEPLSSFAVNHSKSVCRNEIHMNTRNNCILFIILHPGYPPTSISEKHSTEKLGRIVMAKQKQNDN